jgi:ribosome biogenesis protein YTM1
VIRVWQMGKGKSTAEPRATHALALHTSPVSSVRSLVSTEATSESRKKLISAGWDGLVGYWDFLLSDGDNAESGDEDTETPRLKRRRRANGDSTTGDKITKVRPALVLRGHTGQVSRAILDAGTNGKKAYSFGLDDHAVREWDFESAGMETNTKQSDKAIMDAAQLASPNLLVTGNADRTVTLFDMREENTIISMTLNGHASSVSSVAANPNSPFLFCSASYDSTVRIWDARSPKQALFAMKSKQKKDGNAGGKLLATAWDGSIIASGGEDGEVELMQSKANGE